MKTGFLVLLMLIFAFTASATTTTAAVNAHQHQPLNTAKKNSTGVALRRPLYHRADKVHPVAVASGAHAIARPSSPVDLHRHHVARLLFRFMDLVSFLTGKKEDEVLQDAKAKLDEKVAEDAKKHAATNQHRQLPQYELGTAFHVLRFFSNRVAEINDKAYEKMEEEEAEAARLAALGSASSSSSMDADAREAAKIEASRAKAAAAYGLPTPSVVTPTNTTGEPTQHPSPSPSPSSTVHPLLASIEW